MVMHASPWEDTNLGPMWTRLRNACTVHECHAYTYHELQDKVVPPDHIKANNIYSNCYRQSLAQGFGLDDAKERAREAAAEFRMMGYVSRDYVGTFSSKPNRKSPKAKAASKQPGKKP